LTVPKYWSWPKQALLKALKKCFSTVCKKQPTKQIRTKIAVTKGQFHQHFTSSFYAQRFLKLKKDSQVVSFIALSESVCAKAAQNVDEIDPSCM